MEAYFWLSWQHFSFIFIILILKIYLKFIIHKPISPNFKYSRQHFLICVSSSSSHLRHTCKRKVWFHWPFKLVLNKDKNIISFTLMKCPVVNTHNSTQPQCEPPGIMMLLAVGKGGGGGVGRCGSNLMLPSPPLSLLLTSFPLLPLLPEEQGHTQSLQKEPIQRLSCTCSCRSI